MNRVALILILAAMPLLTASMLAQNGDATANHDSASDSTGIPGRFIHGHWYESPSVASGAFDFDDGYATGGNLSSMFHHKKGAGVYGASYFANVRSLFQSSERPLVSTQSRLTAGGFYVLSAKLAECAKLDVTVRANNSILSTPNFEKKWRDSLSARRELAYQSAPRAQTATNGSTVHNENAVAFRAGAAGHLNKISPRPENKRRPSAPDDQHGAIEEDAGASRQYRALAVSTGDFSSAEVKASNDYSRSEIQPMWPEISATPVLPEAKTFLSREEFEMNFVVRVKNSLDEVGAAKEFILKVKTGEAAK